MQNVLSIGTKIGDT